MAPTSSKVYHTKPGVIKSHMSQEPIFIVGVPRSGTTMLAAQLAAHSRLSCGPETHFFRWLAGKNESELLDRRHWPQSALSFLLSITFTTYNEPGRKTLVSKYQIDEHIVRSYLERHKPTIASILGSIVEPYMQRMDKQRWVEKTPDHLRHVALIRKHFPNSPIIRIVRDPRDVALSLMKVPWGVKNLVQGLQFWGAYDEASAGFFEQDNCTYTIRYEDILTAPHETLSDLCCFLGERFEEAMLNTSDTGSAVNSRNVPWKSKARQPIDRNRLEVWRRSLDDDEKQLAESLLGHRIQQYGYPHQATFSVFGQVFPAPESLTKYAEDLAIVASQGVRFWKAREGERPSATVYLGEPGDRSWLGVSAIQRTLTTLKLAFRILTETISRKDLYWIPAQPDNTWTGTHAYVLKQLLSPHKISRESLRPAS